MGEDKNLQNIDDAIEELKQRIDNIEWERGDAAALRHNLQFLKSLQEAGATFVPRF